MFTHNVIYFLIAYLELLSQTKKLHLAFEFADSCLPLQKLSYAHANQALWYFLKHRPVSKVTKLIFISSIENIRNIII